jgi:hypothetical protein
MTPIEKVRSYVHQYLDGAYIIDGGFAKWLVSGTKEQKAKIVKKAIMEGMYIETTDEISPYGKRVRELYLTY